MRKGAVVIVAALALAAFAVGCGGSSEATTVPLSKAQFIKRADAICWRARQRFNALYQPFVKKYGLPEGKRRSLAEYAEAVKTALAPSVEWEVKEIRALGAPRGESRTVDAILAAVESGLEAVERHPGVQADPEKQFAESHKLARAYGLTICGQ